LTNENILYNLDPNRHRDGQSKGHAPVRSIVSRNRGADASHPPIEKEAVMRIAIPLSSGKLCGHFGHCERFALVDADPEVRSILKTSEVVAPPHEPGLLPAWLAERGATVIIAGGMGQRAQSLFHDHRISVVVGAPTGEAPEVLSRSYLAGTLQSGANVCDH
jgi:predicted Fe-Mo cluster-binding NifX family protein